MKKSIIIAVLVVAIGGGIYYFTYQPAVAPEGQPVPVSTEGWKTFSKWGIELKYPPYWIAKENSGIPPLGHTIPEGMQIVGDGYRLAIDPNGGFGEFPSDEFQVVQLRVAGKDVEAVEEINPQHSSYFLIFSLYRPGSNDYYFFRISTDQTVPRVVAKEFIRQILETVRLQ